LVGGIIKINLFFDLKNYRIYLRWTSINPK